MDVRPETEQKKSRCFGARKTSAWRSFQPPRRGSMGPGVQGQHLPTTLPPWEPTTFILRGYNPYIGGVKHPFFMVLGSKG